MLVGCWEQELARLAVLPPSDLVADARRLLETARQTVEEGDEQIYGSTRKRLRSMKRFYSMARSADDSTLAEEMQPSFKKRRPAQSGSTSPATPPPPSNAGGTSPGRPPAGDTPPGMNPPPSEPKA